MKKPLIALAISAFAIGTSEFIIMGLLPDLAHSFQVSIPKTGILVSGYALSVTLGSPLQGADIAAAGGALVPGACPRACQELAPGSSLLARLEAGTRPAIPWLSLWTDQDDVVTPPQSAALPGVRSIRLQSVCDGILINHGQIPTAGLAIGLVLRALGTRPLPVPVPGDCSRLQSEGVGRPVLVGTS